ncbi:MAG: hypothetical protein L6Q77_06685 [Bacteroidetes bacterium]|nr:hypothetical protein [Bacteroidota bacterium]
MKRIFFLSILLFLARPIVFAGANGPITSSIGIGTLKTGAILGMNGIGGAGTALPSYSFFNGLNPAQWVYSRSTHLISGFDYTGNTQSYGGGSAFSGSAGFSGLIFIFPVKNDFNFGLSLLPYSLSNFEVNSTESFQGVSHEVRYYGTGGLSQAGLSGAWKVTSATSIGGTISYYFGNTTQNRSLVFSSTGVTTERIVSNKVKGAGVGLSVMTLAAENLFKENDRLFFSGMADIPFTLTGTRDIENFSDLVDDTLKTSESSTLKLGKAFRAGLGYQVGSRFFAAADLVYKTTSEIAYDNGPTGSHSDVLTLRTGLSYIPDNSAGAYYFERMNYRAGFFIGNSAVKVKGITQDEAGLTAGLGFPLPQMKTLLDLSGGVSWKGYLNDCPAKDTEFSLSVGINLNELWLQKRIID